MNNFKAISFLIIAPTIQYEMFINYRKYCTDLFTYKRKIFIYYSFDKLFA